MSVEMNKKFVTKDNAKEYMDELMYELKNQLQENEDFGDYDACQEIQRDIEVTGYIKHLIDMYM